MKKNITLFICTLLFCPTLFGTAAAAVCSKANLTRCLDSACAVNISSNPAARCQLCGTSSAGGAVTDTGMKRLSIGQSASITLSDTELKTAPSDPGARYAWASAECIKKNGGCIQADITSTYDLLIEQSCKAAGINAQMAALQATARKTKNQNTCNTEINTCMIDAKRCGVDFASCEQNADFDKFFSTCASEVSACGNYTSIIRTGLISARDSAIKNQDTLLANVVAAYQSARDSRLNDAKNTCTDNKSRENCVKDVCAKNMRNKCAVGFANEQSMAIMLCKFHDTACSRLN